MLSLRFRIGVVITVILILASSAVFERRNARKVAMAESIAQDEIERSPEVLERIGSVTTYNQVRRYSDSFEGKPAYTIAADVTGPRGRVSCYIYMVDHDGRWTPFRFYFTDSNGVTRKIIEFGKPVPPLERATVGGKN